MEHGKYNKQTKKVDFWNYANMSQEDIIANAQHLVEVVPVLDGDYKYKFNGKEWQDELGLNLTAMDFRQYDSALGRFLNPDRLTEVMPDWTPYRFGFNNPVYFSDPTGLYELLTNDDGNVTMSFTQDGEADLIMKFFNNWDGKGDFINLASSVLDEAGFGLEIVTLGSVVAEGRSSKSQEHENSQNLRKAAGMTYSLSKPFSEAWSRSSKYYIPSKHSVTSIIYEKKVPKWVPKAGGKTIIYQPIMEMNALKANRVATGLKILSRTAGVAGLGLGVYDMTQNGVTTSNSLDVTMSALALTPTGVTQGIAATYFIANAITSWTTGRDIGQHLDAVINNSTE